MKADRSRFALRDDTGPHGDLRLVTADEAVRALRAGLRAHPHDAAPGRSRAPSPGGAHKLADPGAGAVVRASGSMPRSSSTTSSPAMPSTASRASGRTACRRARCASSKPWRRPRAPSWSSALPLRHRSHDPGQGYYIDPARSLPLTRDPRSLGLRWTDGLWLRLVDVDAALRARSYADGEPVVLEVGDEFCPWNAGRYRGGRAPAGRRTRRTLRSTCRPRRLYLGAFDATWLVHAGRVRELREGATRRASQLFRTDLPPYTPEEFERPGRTPDDERAGARCRRRRHLALFRSGRARSRAHGALFARRHVLRADARCLG